MNKPKVLFILNRLVIGGQALDTIPLIYHLKEEFDILVLYGQKEKDEEDALFLLQQYPGINAMQIKFFRRSINPLNDLIAFFSIYIQIKKFKSTIVHTHGFKSGLIGRIAAKICRVPCIIHTFHGHLFHSYYNKTVSNFIISLERALGKLTNKIVAISDTQKDELVLRYKIVPEKKVMVIYLGVDENFLLHNNINNRITFRQQYQLEEKTIAIAIIGRIVPVKNYTLFINVAQQILTDNKNDIKFLVVGDGQLKSSLQKELDKKNISWCDMFLKENAEVIFTSWISDISKAISGVDIIILTSHNEGTPMSIIEAQLFGKPVVATDVGGVKDTFINDETGFLISPDNENEFVKKLQKLIDDKLLRQQMSSQAISFATSRFSKQKEIDTFKTLYSNC